MEKLALDRKEELEVFFFNFYLSINFKNVHNSITIEARAKISMKLKLLKLLSFFMRIFLGLRLVTLKSGANVIKLYIAIPW